MSRYNILILSAGRRVELVQCFQQAARKLQIKSNVFAGDCSATAPALYFADEKCLMPRIDEADYVDFIVKYCNLHNIVLVVPTIDPELLILAKRKNHIESNSKAKVLISDIELIEICRDKLRTQLFFEENGFGSPKMFPADEINKGELQYPLFIKPRSGSSSINTFKAVNFEELNFYRNIVHEPIIQEYVNGEEYTVDVFLDFDGNVITIVPRLRIAIRGGEISKGKIVKDRNIIEDVHRLMQVLRPIGHITVQLMKTEKGLRYIEINPRFGGGAPMSIQSGADSCENIYRLLMEQKLVYNEDYRSGMIYLRFDNSICIDESGQLSE